VHFADVRIGWAVGNTGTILSTHDGGSTWVVQNGGTNRGLNSVHFVDAHTGWVVGRGTILATQDGEAHWEVQIANPEILSDVHFF